MLKKLRKKKIVCILYYCIIVKEGKRNGNTRGGFLVSPNVSYLSYPSHPALSQLRYGPPRSLVAAAGVVVDSTCSSGSSRSSVIIVVILVFRYFQENHNHQLIGKIVASSFGPLLLLLLLAY